MSALRAGAGHYPQTPLPCEPGNVAIAGHRTTYGKPFHNLDLLKPGDTIVLETPIGSCTYKMVPPPFIVAPTDTSVVDPTPVPTLTLTTCHPKGSARQRLDRAGRAAGRGGRGVMRRCPRRGVGCSSPSCSPRRAPARAGRLQRRLDRPGADGRRATASRSPTSTRRSRSTGQVSHPNGIQQRVGRCSCPTRRSAAPTAATRDDRIRTSPSEQNGTTTTFRVNATFPCNLVYELRRDRAGQRRAAASRRRHAGAVRDAAVRRRRASRPRPCRQVDAHRRDRRRRPRRSRSSGRRAPSPICSATS